MSNTIPIEPLIPIAQRALDQHRDHRGHFEHGADNTHQGVLGIQRNHWLKLRQRKYISTTRADKLATRLGYHPEQIWGTAWNTHYDPPTQGQSRMSTTKPLQRSEREWDQPGRPPQGVYATEAQTRQDLDKAELEELRSE